MSFVPAFNPPNNTSTEQTYGPVTQLPVKVLPDDLKQQIIARANLVNENLEYKNASQATKLNAMGQQISQEKPPFSTPTDQNPSINMAKTTAPPPTQLYPSTQNQNLGQGQPQGYQGQNLGQGQPQNYQGQNLGRGQNQTQGYQGQNLGSSQTQNLGPNQGQQGIQGQPQSMGMQGQTQGYQGQNLGQGQPQNYQGQNLGSSQPQNLGPNQGQQGIQGQPQSMGMQGQNLGQGQPQGYQGPNLGSNQGQQGMQGQPQGQLQGFQGQGGMGQNLGPGFSLPPNAVNLMNQRGPNPPYNTVPQYNTSGAYPPNMGGSQMPPPNLGPGFSYPPPLQGQGMPFPPPNQGPQPPIYGAQPFGLPPSFPMLPHQMPGFMPSQSYGPGYGQQYAQQYVPIHLQDRMYQANIAFDMFDANQNGRISFKEWKNALDYLGFNCTHHQARHLFHTVDVNRSGYITRGEFCNWWIAFEPASFVFPSTLLYY